MNDPLSANSRLPQRPLVIAETGRPPIHIPKMHGRKQLLLQCFLPPGDLCTLTAAIESLHAQYPGAFATGVQTSCDEIFQHNPHVVPVDPSQAELVEVSYSAAIAEANQRPRAFIAAYTEFLGKYLGLPLAPLANRPYLYLSATERGLPQHVADALNGATTYWVMAAGVKRDFTLKQWPVEFFQQVASHFAGRIRFVQIGDSADDHPTLHGVTNLVGRTSHRDLMRLCRGAAGGLGPVTYLQHLCAAFDRPYIALLGGREPVSWTQYPLQASLHTHGMLPCCRHNACWKSRAVALHDGDFNDQSLCELPVLDFSRPVGKCMALIKPQEVIAILERWLETPTPFPSHPLR